MYGMGAAAPMVDPATGEYAIDPNWGSQARDEALILERMQVLNEAPSLKRTAPVSTAPLTSVPSWAWIAAAGVGVLLLLKGGR